MSSSVLRYGDVWEEEDVVQLDVAAPGRWEPFLDWAEERAGLRRTRLYVPDGHELARLADEVAGVVLAYSVRVGDPDMGWVGTLGVQPCWRRRGLGEALLRAAFAALYERGFRRAGLGVDTQNVTGALRLYERAGMRPARRYDNWERET